MALQGIWFFTLKILFTVSLKQILLMQYKSSFASRDRNAWFISPCIRFSVNVYALQEQQRTH